MVQQPPQGASRAPAGDTEGTDRPASPATVVDRRESRLGELLIRENLITESQLREALEEQRARPSYVPLGQVLVEREDITRRQLDLVMDRASKRSRLGELLVRSGVVTEDQLARALQEQKRRRQPLGQVLIELNVLTDERMRLALAQHLNIALLDLDRITVDGDLAKLVNVTYARRHALVPVSKVGQSLTVAMDDPTNRTAIEELARSTGLIVCAVTAPRDAIQRAFNRLYNSEGARPATLAGASTGGAGAASFATLANASEEHRDRQAGQIVHDIVRAGVERGCSDIHMETLSEGLRLRFRIDGVLNELDLGPVQRAIQQDAGRIVSRVKILAKLDPGERRRPQDGRVRMVIEHAGEQKRVDLRVSVVPGYYGESIVMRVLDSGSAPTSLAPLGFSPEITRGIEQLLHRPSGALLVTGPAGSGKSTTLYAALATLYRPEIRIVTVEDPVERVYAEFSQSEVNERIGNSFASYVRAFLRQDPEVIMVGELRDQETASLALRAAQAGHLVLSAVQTNTAIAAVNRLLDLTADPNLVTSSVAGVISQRLVREVCPSCKAPYSPSDELVREFFDKRPAITFYKGRGCEACNFSGYHGRTAVAQLWTPDEHDVISITRSAPPHHLREGSNRNGVTMARDVAARLVAGRTNLEELVRVLPYSAVYEFRRLEIDAPISTPSA